MQARGLKVHIEAAIKIITSLPDMVEGTPSMTATSIDKVAKGIQFELAVIVPSYMLAADVRISIEAAFTAMARFCFCVPRRRYDI